MKFNVAELMLFTTCNYNCAYCGFAESGASRNADDMAPFRNKQYIDSVFNFFESHSTDTQKWILHLSGGEPLLMPNSDYFSRKFIDAGHKLGYNTNLSLPVEKNGWISNNPPEGIDSLIVSLHPESVAKLDVIVERARILREAGYPIVIRMVAHPKVLSNLPSYEEKFREINVSFAVNAFYSPSYPKAYTSAERETVVNYMRTNYQVIQLNGGLDMRGRRCKAGSGLICVALGRSGRGNVYPCVSTSNPQHCLGNIFEKNVKLYEHTIGCLREDKLCSCAIHFNHDILPSVDDSISQQKMLYGYKTNVSSSWRAWFAERNIKTSYHDVAPQGTKGGETELVLKKYQSEKPHQSIDFPLSQASEQISIPSFINWDAIDSSTIELCDDEMSLHIVGKPTKYNYLSQSPLFVLGAGVYQLRYYVSIAKGGVTIGLVDGRTGGWLAQQNHEIASQGRLNFVIKSRRKVRIVVASCNHQAERSSDVILSDVQLHGAHDIKQVVLAGRLELQKKYHQYFLERMLPFFYLLKLHGASIIGKTKIIKGYVVTNVVRAGYAVRSITMLDTGGGRYLLTADIGDDAISIFPVENGRLGKRSIVRFPHRSTPMYVNGLSLNDEVGRVLISFFNFDTAGQSEKNSYLASMPIPADLRAGSEIAVDNIPQCLSILLQRSGHWGYRGAAVLNRANGEKLIAVVDRDRSELSLLSWGGEKSDFKVDLLSLGDGVEPIGINFVANLGGIATYYITSRSTEQILVVGVDAEGRPRKKQSFPIPGLSRSSVAVGRFRSLDNYEVAVATWGGDPKELNTIEVGQVVVGQLRHDGAIESSLCFAAGVHPTDVAAGDLDGDGLDELVVLNYGSGINVTERRHPGGVQIFKFLGDSFRCIKEISLPNPRIAYIGDIDADGKNELVVSLFFEKRLAIVKYCD